MLKQHEYYVYHDATTVFARMRELAPVVIKECASTDEAALLVETIVNPRRMRPDDFTETRKNHKGDTVALGLLSKGFQDQISKNCKAAVEAAYATAGGTK
jgi:hypothetical protein